MGANTFAGWGSVFAVMLMRKLGRLPVLWWTQLFALAFMVGCTFAPNLSGFAGVLRCLIFLFGLSLISFLSLQVSYSILRVCLYISLSTIDRLIDKPLLSTCPQVTVRAFVWTK